MIRWRLLAIVIALASPGCSLILDFDKPPPDAGIDPALCAFGEPNETLAAAAPILTTDVGPAAVCSDATVQDFDFYGLAIPANTTVQITIVFASNGGRGDLDLFLYDTSGTILGTAVTFGDNEVLTCPNASPPCPMLADSNYVFEVRGATPSVTNTYDFAVAITP
jgi:hypothetical protein